VPVLRPSGDSKLPVIMLGGSTALQVDYEQRPITAGTEGSELSKETFVTLTLENDLKLYFPATALTQNTELDAMLLSTTALETRFLQNEYELSIPGSVDRSKFNDATILLASAFLSLKGTTEFTGEGFSLAIPSNALPSSGIPSNALPSSALPSNALPSNALPSNALPSSLISEALFSLSDLPDALAAQALPSSWFLRQNDASNGPPILETLLTCRDRTGLNYRTHCKATTELAEASTMGLNFSCPITGTLLEPNCEITVMLLLQEQYLQASLDEIPLHLLKDELVLNTNTTPTITMPEHLQIQAGTTSYALISVDEPDADLLLAELENKPEWIHHEHHRLVFSPAATLQDSTAEFTVRVIDNGNPRAIDELLHPAHHLEVCIHAPTVAGDPRRCHPVDGVII